MVRERSEYNRIKEYKPYRWFLYTCIFIVFLRAKDELQNLHENFLSDRRSSSGSLPSVVLTSPAETSSWASSVSEILSKRFN